MPDKEEVIIPGYECLCFQADPLYLGVPRKADYVQVCVSLTPWTLRWYFSEKMGQCQASAGCCCILMMKLGCDRWDWPTRVLSLSLFLAQTSTLILFDCSVPKPSELPQYLLSSRQQLYFWNTLHVRHTNNAHRRLDSKLICLIKVSLRQIGSS